MKKIILFIAASLLLSTTSFSQEKLNINIQESTIKWIGEYTFYFGGHNGFIQFKEGHFIKTNDIITGGKFVIDINHLKEPDFFDVKKHPLGSLKITKVEYSDKTHARIEADLTLKGVTESINFRVEFNYAEKEMKTRFKIDRKRWNVNYKSKFKDGAISDAIGFEVSIKL